MRRPVRPAKKALRQPKAHRAVAVKAATPALTDPRPAVDVVGVLQAAVGAHQAGNAAEAERLYRQVLDADPEQPDALHLLGVLAYQHGRPDIAVSLIERAVAIRPSSPAYRLNLGSVLLALGRLADAVASYRTAAALAPDDADAYYNLGNALSQLGDADGGIAALQRAVQLRPDHPLAHYNLGNALRAAHRLGEAVAAYQAVVGQQPGHVDALTNLGVVLHELGRRDEARACFDQALAIQPDHLPALVNLAEALQAQGALDGAMARYQRVLALDPNNVAALRGQTAIHQTLLALAADDTFDVQQLALSIARIIMSDPAYPALLEAARSGADPFRSAVPLPATLLANPAVLAALPRVVIYAPDVERVLTTLRRHTLLRMSLTPPGTSVRSGTDLPLPRPFLCALAGAAFLAEHAWLIEPDEAARLDALRATLAQILADPAADLAADLAASEDLLLLAALYDRLDRLPDAHRLATVPVDRWSEPFVAVIREQVVEPLEERAIAASLTQLTPIADAVSQAVQAMYEENPYPRWRTAAQPAQPLVDWFLALCPGEPVPDWPSPLPVLVAGAGTGQHPIRTARRLPEADVLAVDLSRSSLAYGARMAARLGIPNLTLAQADILALDILEQRFALIESWGVLHHLADPLAGWAVLRRLLRPDGLMLIALYSELGRQDIVAARQWFAAEGIPPTSDGIKEARRRLLNLPSDHPMAGLSRFSEFYSESGFRDLTMHVQEHRFTIPRLAAALDALDLRFLGFMVPPAVRDCFRERFPTPGADLDLACWDQFEHEHPATFASMYELWCRPR